ncbi:protein of unknown function (plasmid) [Cupriavidus taiwanensis]|uniref:Uncharacterized protein n=1 Tax=Cupriavidus taiwanensis TaxID=164546 RepID=A0A7Z7JIA3_9BURK|nr:hypothetical protein CBM2597_U60012 [Cupriavidus taiwanensis]SOZ97296.1 hypothetical protein CBM2598_U60019 [Cupriavidus taiwanensis]SPC26185.1 hypothetical protein CBM2594_U70018 [Cupriavidus taiwanensis]SPD37683.1 protein of unknown function [Cupriavidus taiwanensis]
MALHGECSFVHKVRLDIELFSRRTQPAIISTYIHPAKHDVYILYAFCIYYGRVWLGIYPDALRECTRSRCDEGRLQHRNALPKYGRKETFESKLLELISAADSRAVRQVHSIDIICIYIECVVARSN